MKKKEHIEREKLIFPIQHHLVERLRKKRLELIKQKVRPGKVYLNRMVEYLLNAPEFDEIIDRALKEE